MAAVTKRIILCDIDHTLANACWRDKMVGGEGGWDAYHLAGDQDPPVEVMFDLVRTLQASGNYDLWGLTARPEKWRKLTMTYLVRYSCPMEGILMRPHDDFRPSPLVKIDLAKAKFDLSTVAFLIEDRDDVAAVFRAEGVVVLQCHISPGVAPSVPFGKD